MIHLMFSDISLANAYKANATYCFINMISSSSDSGYMSSEEIKFLIQFISPSKNDTDFDFEAS